MCYDCEEWIRGVLRTLSNIWDEAFCENSQWLIVFGKGSFLDVVTVLRIRLYECLETDKKYVIIKEVVFCSWTTSNGCMNR